MKAVKVALLLLCINSAIFVVNATDVWGESDLTGGATPQDIQESDNLRVEEATEGSLDLPDILIGNTLSVAVLVGAVIAASFTALTVRISTPQAVGIVAFAVLFGFMLGQMSGVLQQMQLPSSLVTVLTGFQFFWMMVAIIQLATGWQRM